MESGTAGESEPPKEVDRASGTQGYSQSNADGDEGKLEQSQALDQQSG